MPIPALSVTALTTRGRIQKLEQSYLSSGGVSPHDVLEIRRLLAENGIPVNMSNEELVVLAISHFQQQQQLLSSSHRSHPPKSPRMHLSVGGAGSPLGDVGNGSFSSAVLIEKLTRESSDNRRRMSLAEYTALANQVRKHSVVAAGTADEDELQEQFTGEEDARARRRASRAPGYIPGPRTFEDALTPGMAAHGDSTSTGDDSDDDYNFDACPASSEFGSPPSFSNSFTAFGPQKSGASFGDFDDESNSPMHRGVSLRVIQKRLQSVGLAEQAMTTITGHSSRKHYRLNDKLTFDRLKEVIELGKSDSSTHTPSPRKGDAFRNVVRSAFGAVMDGATLFRRFGGDPTDHNSCVSKDRILGVLAASRNPVGLSRSESNAYRDAIEACESTRLDFDAFLEAIGVADMAIGGGGISSGGAAMLSDDEEGLGDSKRGRRHRPHGSSKKKDGSNALLPTSSAQDANLTPNPSVAEHPMMITASDFFPPQSATLVQSGNYSAQRANDIAIHDAAAAFFSHLSQNRRKTQNLVLPSEKLRQKLSKTLNDHLAKTHRSCTFAKGLVYVLRLDVQLLNAFVLRSKGRLRGNTFSPFALALKVLKAIERTVVALRAHQTCQVCYLKLEPKSPRITPQCADRNNLINFMRLPNEARVEGDESQLASTNPTNSPRQRRGPQPPTMIRAEGVVGLNSSATARNVVALVGTTTSRTQADDPLSLAGSTLDEAPAGATWQPVQIIHVRGEGFTAKTLTTQPHHHTEPKKTHGRPASSRKVATPPRTPHQPPRVASCDATTTCNSAGVAARIDAILQRAHDHERLQLRHDIIMQQHRDGTPGSKKAPVRPSTATAPARATGRRGFHF
ncbi:Hypothetical protein, putative [Bodo saltans]|uniref:Uncharacterized protein n=1 Tax=Bodo saltans TaxID=75058 RepID=A0A0S4JP95_BODSA|nr:Hypothetical protein, putative [Bodo saltans]|eukprot:CUG90329.1 Hypothetical protein, putative [Bodo saltans]